MASYLDHGDDRRVRPRAYRARRHPLLGRDRPRPVRPAARRAPATQFALSQVGEHVLQAADAHDRRARRRRAAVVLGHARHRAGLGLLLRRGAHGRRATTGRRCPTSTATRSQDTGLRLPVLAAALHPFLAHYQTDNGDGTCAPTGTHRRVVRRPAAQRRLRAVDGRPVGATPASRSRSRSATPATTSCSSRGVFVDDIVVSDRRGLDVVRGRRRHARRLDRRRARPRAASQRQRLDRRHRAPTRRRPPARSPQASLDRAAGDHRLPVRALRPVPVLGRRRDRRRRRRARLRAREPDAADLRARLLRRPRRPATRVVVHELAHQWTGDRPGARARGSTSGSTRASRPTPSGCGASARAAARRRRSSTSSTVDPGRRPVLGADDRRPRARTTCSTSPSTTAAR